MENVNMEYSAIYYYSELDIQKINNIKKLLKTGIIVNLFLNYSFEVELELNEYNEIDFLKYAKSNGFLNIFDDLGELNYDEGLVAYDGNILNKSFYEDVCCSKENKFNNEQYEIINANTNKNIIVTASAGTGKTTAMINRLMFLRKTVKDFIFSNTILITFTNEASIEMRERLIEILEKYYSFTEDVTYLNMLSEVSETNISTIHSFAKSIIDEFSLNKSINEKIKITTFEDYKKLFLEEAIDKFSKEYPDIYLNVKYFPMYDLVNKIKTIWGKLDNHSIDLNSDKIKLDFGQDENKVSFLIEYVLRYANKKLHDIKENKLEVSDLMKRITNIELIQRINHNYKLIMVDEFQDIDNIQIKFITDLCKYKNLDLFSVGDEKQSIYRFRGAEYTAFKKLKEHLKYNPKQLLEFTLVQNYRTEAELLKDINNLFIDIDKRIFKFKYKENDYIYSKINTNKPNNIIYKSLKEDKNKVELLDKLLDKKQPEETIAILVRSNEDALEIKSMCDIYNIPCHVETKGDFYRQGVVKDFYLMIKSLIYLKDNRINYSLINSPYIKDTVNKKEIIERFNEEDKKIDEYLNNILCKNNWDYYRKKIHNTNPLSVIDEIINTTKPELNYYRKKSMNLNSKSRNIKLMALEYKINLDYLVYLLKDKFLTEYVSIERIEKFLRVKIATDKSVDARKPSKKNEKEYVKCMTVHRAKGLQFEYVILPKTTNKFLIDRKVEIIFRNIEKEGYKIGYKLSFKDNNEDKVFKNNYFNQYMRDEKSEIIAEETRLFYVATTRCKKELYIDKREVSANTSINSWENLISGGIENV